MGLLSPEHSVTAFSEFLFTKDVNEAPFNAVALSVRTYRGDAALWRQAEHLSLQFNT